VAVLDSSFLIDLLRGHAPAVTALDALEGAGESQVVPAPVVFELAVELGKKRTPAKRADRVRAALADLAVHPLNETIALEAGRIAGALEDAGTPIDDVDCMIAATALALDARLVTGNRKHFERVPGIRIMDY
jgi:tRNA(fMet)-specific endonuclease VapC